MCIRQAGFHRFTSKRNEGFGMADRPDGIWYVPHPDIESALRAIVNKWIESNRHHENLAVQVTAAGRGGEPIRINRRVAATASAG